jgi:hypothetical protein
MLLSECSRASFNYFFDRFAGKLKRKRSMKVETAPAAAAWTS